MSVGPQFHRQIEILGGLCPLEHEIVPFPEDKKIIDIGDYYGDYGALEAVTGWKPRISLREGLARTLDYYRAHPERYL